MIDLTGKVAIVTGGASGIGAATSALLARLGAAVAIADINEAGSHERVAEIVNAGGRALAVPTDVCEPDQVQDMVGRTVSEFGRLDILHNNAAGIELVGGDLRVTEIDLANWEKTLRTDLTGPMLGCRYGIPAMIDTGGGSIINTSSISGLRAEYYMTAYPVAKAGVVQLTQEVALQYGRDGIRCNAVAPGLTLSPAGLGMPEPVRDMYMHHNAIPYIGKPADIAPVVAFLASDEARYVTGEVITADGGLTKTIAISADYREWAASQSGSTW